MIAKFIAAVDQDEARRLGGLTVPEPVVATLQCFVLQRRTGNVILSFRGGDLQIVKVEETAPVRDE